MNIMVSMVVSENVIGGGARSIGDEVGKLGPICLMCSFLINVAAVFPTLFLSLFPNK